MAQGPVAVAAVGVLDNGGEAQAQRAGWQG
jgi:hypothetical protein